MNILINELAEQKMVLLEVVSSTRDNKCDICGCIIPKGEMHKLWNDTFKTCLDTVACSSKQEVLDFG